MQQFESSSILLAPVLSAAAAISDAIGRLDGQEPLRILVAEPFCLGLLQVLTPLIRAGRAVATVIGTNVKRLNLNVARRGGAEGIEFLAIDAEADIVGETVFDLAFAVAFGPVFDDDADLGRAIARRMSPQGLLCVLQPPDNAIFDILLGSGEGWFASSSDPRAPIGRIAAGQESTHRLVASGFGRIDRISVGPGAGDLLLASPLAYTDQSAPISSRVVLVGADSSLTAPLSQALRADGHSVQKLPALQPTDYGSALPEIALEAASGGIIELVFSAFTAGHDALDRSISHLAAILGAGQAGKCRLWILVRGLQADDPRAIDPIAEAVWCFARVAMNEYPAIDVKLVDIAPDLDTATAGSHLATLIASPGTETELLIDKAGLSAARITAGLPSSHTGGVVPAARLELKSKSLSGSFDWLETERREPDPSEIEIKIAAAGR